MKHKLAFILFSLLILQSCGTSFETNPKNRLYKTLTRKSPWKIESLHIYRVNEAHDLNVQWDTTLYNWGSINFEKNNYEDFSAVLDFTENYSDLTLQNYVTEVKEELYLSFKAVVNGFAYEHGSGIANNKKGKEITITGRVGQYLDQGQTYPYAPFITEPAYYRCEWKLKSED